MIAAVFAAGAGACAIALWLGPMPCVAGIIALSVAAAVGERVSVNLYFDGRLSISFMAVVFAAAWFGPAGTAIVASSIALALFLFKGRAWRKLAFNFGQQNLSALLAAAMAMFVERSLDSMSGSVGGHALVLTFAGTAAGGVVWTITTSCVALIVSLTTGRGWLETHRENFLWMLPHYLALGAVAGGLAASLSTVGILGLLVLATPLVLSRYAMKQVVDKTRENVLQLERSNADLRHAHVEITEMSEQIREAYDGTLESLVAALDLRDQETRGHSNRVASHSVDVAKLLGIVDVDELEMIYRGALMHDVGKIGVPDHILLKPGKLTEEEWEFMRRHPAFGYRILAQVPYLRPAAKVVLAHHERWDGDGYPRRLKAEEIPLGARIFAISDTFDAIVSDRPYRKGKTPEEARDEILRCAGTQFDPRVAEAFEAVFPGWRAETLGEKTLYLPERKRTRPKRVS